MKPRKLLTRLASGSLTNVSFADFQRFVEAFGWRLSRTSGSHHVYVHPDLDQLVNLQEVRGEAKPYQIRQFLRLVERYNLRMGDRQ